MPEALPSWLASPGLLRLWPAVAARLERASLAPTGQVSLTNLDRDERHAIGDLVGRPLVAPGIRIDLADLDGRLLRRSGRGLVEVVELALNRSLVDRPGVRSDRAASRQAPFDAAVAWLEQHPVIDAQPWLQGWLEALRSDGILARDPDGSATLLAALAVVDRVLTGAPGLSRTDLAAVVLHDSHALDDGSRVAHLALRALAARAGRPIPSDAGGRRSLWELHGVWADHVSTTCLTLGLRVGGDSARARGWTSAAHEGDPVHLTWWDLHRDPLEVDPGGPVLVCENPRVLEAVASRHGGRYPVVCTSGRPALVVLEVLRRLAASGTSLRYHGDFDWAGVAIANQMRAEVGAAPWLMSARDYLDAPAAVPLLGQVVEARWDASLAGAMSRRGLVVHEEAVLPIMLERLPE